MARLDRQTKQAYVACAQAITEGRIDLDAADASGFSVDQPVFSVSQAAQLVIIHPQTLRQYDRLGLVVPQRTEGGSRRYALRDIDRLMLTQHLVQDESINLAGVSRILQLMEENRQLRRQVRRLKQPEGASVFTAGMDGEVVEILRSNRERAQAMAQARGLGVHTAGEDGVERVGAHGVRPARGRFLPRGASASFTRELTSAPSEDVLGSDEDFNVPFTQVSQEYSQLY
ncbi:heat shock protein transcriptional repressor HspR [Alloscardovia omnicolens]|uniref:heat shock protein transcriptional repressor HspR n=1 Tax=Alloscardovia omnicolens TaxID=419015 RepID=UPI002430C89F|nr:MerR family transcriptional regulator [Alloscardovia omnicolens]MDK6644051.1 MerR family transcriptional regulator [Alloscardovia omnicolens]